MNTQVFPILIDTVDFVEPEPGRTDAEQLADSQRTSSDSSRVSKDSAKVLAKFDALIDELKSEATRERRAFQAQQRKERKVAAAAAEAAAVAKATAVAEETEVAAVGESAVAAETTATSTEHADDSAPEPRLLVGDDGTEIVLRIEGIVKHFGDTAAVNGISLSVPAGSIFGIVGPNGAGKTTTLSMVTGLLRPDAGVVTVHGSRVWDDPAAAKRQMGVLPDRLRLFDRLTGNQLLFYAGVLRGLPADTVRERISELATSFGLGDALGRLVSDYSAGMTKKLALAAALIHSPRLLVLDEPFESVDPVSAANVTEILKRYADAGGTVVLSSHSMDLIQRVCDSVAVIDSGVVLASGTVAEVRGKGSLEEKFVELVGGRTSAEGMEWLHSFSD